MASILLVDDHMDMQMMLRELLEWEGHQVMVGRTGNEGLEALDGAGSLPDIIISDLTMPVMNGLEFLDEVRKNSDWSAIRFVIMSANPQDSRLRNVQIAGLDGILPKPFSIEELNRMLEQ